jgi:hypothetical protein
VSENIILLPNAKEGCIDLYRIPNESDGPHESSLLLCLSLPEVNKAANGELHTISCCSGQPITKYSSFLPGQTTTGGIAALQSPFTEAVIAFNVQTQYMRSDGLSECPLFRFVMHRQSILELVETTTTLKTAQTDNLHYLDWSEWGPSRTRWFDISTSCDDIPNVAWGQRLVSIRRDSSDNGAAYPLSVYNFNPSAVAASADAITSLDRFARLENWTGDPDTSPFEEIWSQLAYAEAVSPFEFADVEIALMDEDRVVLVVVRDGLLYFDTTGTYALWPSCLVRQAQSSDALGGYPAISSLIVIDMRPSYEC